MKVVVFTAIMVKDPLKDKPIDNPSDFNIIPGWDYVLLTNIHNGKEVFKNSGWNKGEIRIIEPPEEDMPSRNSNKWEIYAARWFKWHPDKIFGDYDIVIWVDGWQIINYNKINEIYELINNTWKDLQVNDSIVLLQDIHPKNNCIYDEHKYIIECKKDTYFNILKVTKYIKTMRCPKDIGLYWTGCYIYKTNSQIFQNISNDLWNDMLLYTYRDQALLTYELWRNNALDKWKPTPLNKLVIAVDTNNNHHYI
jgi:hypothetical protein